VFESFYPPSCFKTRNGEMLFGGSKEIIRFRPEEIRKQNYVPPIVLTDFLLEGRSVPIGKLRDGRQLLTRYITAEPAITLSYKDKFFSIGYAALDFSSPKHNQYAYKCRDLILTGSR